jgi:hypothetical protein
MKAPALHPLAELRDAVERARGARPGEACEMCGAWVPPDHRHVVDTVDRSLKCLCTPCFLLFSDAAAASGRYRQVSSRYAALPGLQLSDADWDALSIPVSLAFFFQNSSLGRTVAFYPGPGGATESLLPLDAWQHIVSANPALGELAPDVEAILVRQRRDGVDCYVVPIDACYELVGRLRLHWSGFDGGAEARAHIDNFFADVRRRAGGSESRHA